MERNGSLIYWEVTDFKTTKTVLDGLGFGDTLPRNDAKAALIKALKIVTKGNERFYKRFADSKHEVRFAVVNPEVIVTEEDIDIDFEKELILVLDKSTGILSRNRNDVEHEAFFNRINEHFRVERGTVNATQFRLMVTKFFKRQAYAIPMRSRGGIYFVHKAADQTVELVKGLFRHFAANATLHIIPVFNEHGTLTAIESAATSNIQGEIDALLASMDTEEFTSRHLTGREDEVNRIIEKVKFHEETLRGQAENLSERLTNIKSVIGRIRKGSGHVSFMDMLESM